MQAKTFDTLLFIVLLVIAISSLAGSYKIVKALDSLRERTLVVQRECVSLPGPTHP